MSDVLVSRCIVKAALKRPPPGERRSARTMDVAWFRQTLGGAGFDGRKLTGPSDSWALPGCSALPVPSTNGRPFPSSRPMSIPIDLVR